MDIKQKTLNTPKYVMAALFCLLLGPGCSKAPIISEYRIGDRVVTGALTYNVVEARWSSQLEAFPAARIPDRNFLLVRVVITNGGGSDASIPFLKLENSRSDTYAESNDGAGVDNWLGLLRRVAPAQTVDGWLLFDVPTSSYRLRVTDGAIEDEKVAFVTIPLTLQQ